jgi:hypothetical protein
VLLVSVLGVLGVRMLITKAGPTAPASNVHRSLHEEAAMDPHGALYHRPDIHGNIHASQGAEGSGHRAPENRHLQRQDAIKQRMEALVRRPPPPLLPAGCHLWVARSVHTWAWRIRKEARAAAGRALQPCVLVFTNRALPRCQNQPGSVARMPEHARMLERARMPDRTSPALWHGLLAAPRARFVAGAMPVKTKAPRGAMRHPCSAINEEPSDHWES